LRRDNPDLREALVAELQLVFREIQKRRMPQLSTVEWIELFAAWGREYAARCGRRRDEAIATIIATIDEYTRANGPGNPWVSLCGEFARLPDDPFVCPCGETLTNPGDPAVMAVHQPHYMAAKAARR